MPEGSLQLNLETLQSALSGVEGLLGAAGTGRATGSGYAGAAQLVESSPAEQADDVAGRLKGQLSGILTFEASASITGIADTLGNLGDLAAAPPLEPLNEFAGRLREAGGVFEEGLVQQLEDALTALRSLSDGVPADGAAIAGALLDQLLRILRTLDGPEAADIRAWAQSFAEMAGVLGPLIEAAESDPDPTALALQVFQHALDSTLDVFGAAEVQRLVALLEDFPAREVNAAAVAAASDALTAVAGSLGDVQAVAAAEYPAFRDAAVAAAGTMEEFRAELRPVLSGMRRVAGAPIFQPGALERYLREQMETALSVEVHDVQRLDDPFNALFDRIDEAIDGVDLSEVRTEILGFFEELRGAIEGLDVGSLIASLEEQLGTVQSVVQKFEASVTDLTARVEAFFDGTLDQARGLAGNVGAFQSDGTFRYHVENDLRGVLTTARTAIGGDPSDPDAPSVAGTLGEFQSAIDRLLSDLDGLLGSVGDELEGVTSTAVGGIEDFTAFVEGLDLQALVEQLRSEIEQILEALGPVDFSAVVDPIVAQLNENAGKLSEIDPEALNDLLREALATALDIVIHIDFTAEISTPLIEEFQTVKELPAQAIEELQRRYEEVLSLLDHLSPQQLIAALSSAFEVIDSAVGALDLAAVLEPLDALHDRYLRQPLAELRPSVLLEPVGEAYDELTGVLDQIDGAAAVAPVNAQLEAFKSRVEAFDVTRWVDDLTASVESIKADVRGIRPSEFLEPLTEEFDRLESELDRVRPSILLAPVAALATPLLDLVEDVQQDTVTALFEMFQAPVRLLDALHPAALTAQIEEQIDTVIASIESLRLPARFNQLKGQHYDLRLEVQAGGVEARLALVTILDPERQLGELVAAHNEILAALRGLKANLRLPELLPLYDDLRERLLAMLPPYAREMLDPETFQRLMRLADPSRFLVELDTRFDALVARLVPIRPQDLADELDATYETVLDFVESIDVADSLAGVAAALDSVRDTVAGVRVDFIAADIDRLVGELRAMSEALNIRTFYAELDEIHHEVELVVQETKPSEVLSGLQATLEQVQALVAALDPRVVLGEPLTGAWESIGGALAGVDFTVILQPLIDVLDDLEVAFEAALQETEGAFDDMLKAGRGALRNGGASATVSI